MARPAKRARRDAEAAESSPPEVADANDRNHSPPDPNACPLDILPDEVLSRALAFASSRDWNDAPACADCSPLDPQESPLDVQVALLWRLRAVSKRFKRLCEHPAMYARLALQEATDEAADALARLPWKAREAIRSMTLVVADPTCSLSFVGWSKLLRRALPAVQDLSVTYIPATSGGSSECVCLPALALFHQCTSLRSLAAYSWHETDINKLLQKCVQLSFGLLSRLSLAALELQGFPLTPEGIGPLFAPGCALAQSLRSADLSVYLHGTHSIGHALAAVAELRSLVKLRLRFHRFLHTAEETFTPRATAEEVAHVQPLARLKALSLGLELDSLAFVPWFRELEHLRADLAADCDCGPLAAAAGTLRSLALRWVAADDREMSARTRSSLAAALHALRALEILDVKLTPACYADLAVGPATAGGAAAGGKGRGKGRGRGGGRAKSRGKAKAEEAAAAPSSPGSPPAAASVGWPRLRVCTADGGAGAAFLERLSELAPALRELRAESGAMGAALGPRLRGLRVLHMLDRQAATADFLRSLPAVQLFSASFASTVDVSPLASAAECLRELHLQVTDPSEAARAALVAALLTLHRLTVIRLLTSRAALEALAHVRLRHWTELRKAVLGCTDNLHVHAAFLHCLPGPLLKRLGEDVPSLRDLVVHSPLPDPGDLDLEAIAALRGLRRLCLRGGGTEQHDEDDRDFLQAVLPSTQILPYFD